MLHKHRILPGHLGGTYESNNVVLLTVSEHAEAHRILWQKYGHQEDFIAWQGLSGAINKETIISEVLSLAGHKGGSAGKGISRNKGNKRPDLSARNELRTNKGVPKSAEHREKIRLAAKRRWASKSERLKQSARLKEYYAA